MRVYAISDLHLGFAVGKTMDVFGDRWRDHHVKIESNWRRTVSSRDVVAIAGDISWAMRLEEALPDLDFIGRLPGKKVFIRGNHDYWCSQPAKVRERLHQSIIYLRNGAEAVGSIGFAGARGWLSPGAEGFDPQSDGKLFRRGLIRLRSSLEALARIRHDISVVLVHFPPTDSREVTELLEEFEVDHCVYGHLHGDDCAGAFEGRHNGVEYHFTSADHVGFAPRLVVDTE